MRPTTTDNLTKEKIERLIAKGVQTKVKDTRCPGLILRIGKSATTWNVVVWSPSRRAPVKRSLGRWPTVTVGAARTKAEALIPTLRQAPGPTPDPTLADLVALYTDKNLAADLRKPRWAEAIYNRYWSGWARRKVGEITPAQIASRHSEISVNHGPGAALQALRVLRALYAYAVSLELCTRNPAKLVKLSIPPPRGRYLSGEEHQRLVTVLDSVATPEYVRDYIYLLIYTGQRRSNVAAMRWDQVQGDIWVVPAESAKGKRDIHVQLIPQALEILARRPKDGKWLFPGTGAAGHIRSVQRQWARIRTQAGIPDVTLHDLRRSFAVRLIQSGASLPVVQSALGHADPSTTARIYAIATPEGVRGAIEKAFA